MEKRISYLNKTYPDYKMALIDFSKKYYPDLATDFDDASVGAWMIDLNAEIGDNLSFYIDRAFQETNINSASEKSSIYNIARTSGFKIPGPKGSMAEVKLSCYLPLSTGGDTRGVKEPDWEYAPIIKRGTVVSSSSQSFELLSDVDFAEQFDENGYSNRVIIPINDANGLLTKYLVSKYAVVTAGSTNIFRKEITVSDEVPFFEFVIPAENVMSVESIVMKDGNKTQSYPSMGEFFMPNETSDTFVGTTRFFEVDYLAQQFMWGEKEENGQPVKYEFSYVDEYGNAYPAYYVSKGEWKPLRHKFITEYTDKGYLKIIFGAGIDPATEIDLNGASDFARHQITKTIKNNSLGVLPKAGTTLFVMYRTGGGRDSNLATGAINTISTLKVEIPCTTTNSNVEKREAVKRSITVLSTSPSVSGKDMPTVDEIKYMVKYNAGAQDRCVTTKDYIDRILKLPSKYGTPFRVGVSEENNKIMIYLLGIDYRGYLDASLPSTICENIQDYLSEYRMINDFVEIKSGRIVNVSFKVNVVIDKNYNQADVTDSIRELITNYMDVNKHNMGDDIYIGDIEKEISKLDGVINLVALDVFNEVGAGYSKTMIAQELVSRDKCSDKKSMDAGLKFQVDLEAGEKTLYSDGDTMLELKYPLVDINIEVKLR